MSVCLLILVCYSVFVSVLFKRQKFRHKTTNTSNYNRMKTFKVDLCFNVCLSSYFCLFTVLEPIIFKRQTYIIINQRCLSVSVSHCVCLSSYFRLSLCLLFSKDINPDIKLQIQSNYYQMKTFKADICPYMSACSLIFVRLSIFVSVLFKRQNFYQ